MSERRKTIHIPLSEKEKEKIKEVAEAEHLSVSGLIRKTILDRHDQIKEASK